MPLKSSFWSYLLLAVYVICYSAGLFSWGSSFPEFEQETLQKAIGQGWLIALVYLGLQTKFYLNANWLHKLHFLAPVALYLETYQSALPFLLFWSLLLLQFILIVTYEEWIVWRRIPVLKNLLIAARNYPVGKVQHILILIQEYNLRVLGINDADNTDADLLKELVVKIMDPALMDIAVK